MAKQKLGSTKLTDDLFVGSITLTTDVTGILPVANGGTGVNSLGANVVSALQVNVGTAGSIVVNGGALGTPSSGTLTNVSGLPIDGGTTGTLPVGRGGTGLTAGISGGMPYFSGTGTIASSALLNADRVVLGGGAGNAPKTMADPSFDFQVLVGFTTGEPDWMYITESMWDSSLTQNFGIIVWGTPSAESSNAIEVTATVAQGITGGGALASTNSVIKVVVSDSATNCSPSATATLSAAGTPTGTLLDGSGTATAIFQTTSAGTFRVKVTETAAASRYLWVENGIGSRVYLKAATAPTALTFA